MFWLPRRAKISCFGKGTAFVTFVDASAYSIGRLGGVTISAKCVFYCFRHFRMLLITKVITYMTDYFLCIKRNAAV